jgi:hypothetical protein
MFFKSKWFSAFAGMTNQDLIRGSLEIFTTENTEIVN